MFIRAENADYDEDVDLLEYPFMTKRSVYSILTDEVRKRGIVEECCAKSCSLGELQSYCR